MLRDRDQEHLRVGTSEIGLTRDARANGPFEGRLVFAEELFPVFDEADQHHDD